MQKRDETPTCELQVHLRRIYDPWAARCAHPWIGRTEAHDVKT